LEVIGGYSGDRYASIGPTHERSKGVEIECPEKGELPLKVIEKRIEKATVLRIVIFTIIGVTDAVALCGFIIS
jgi:hypothetical protein